MPWPTLDELQCDMCMESLGKHTIEKLKECLRDCCESRYENMMGDDL